MSKTTEPKDITSKVFSRYVPKAAVIAYKKYHIDANGNDSPGDDYSLEVRPIRQDGTFGPGKPAGRKFISSLLQSFSADEYETPHGRMPDNMLYADTRASSRLFVWYTPPGKRMRYFIPELGIPDGEYYVPGCIYVASHNSLQVYAFKGRKPKDNTRLLWGPFFNAYEDHICTGNAKGKLKDLTWEGVQEYWENIFWNSLDAHLGSQRPTRDNLVLTIKKYKDIPFDCDELLPRNKRLKDIFPKE